MSKEGAGVSTILNLTSNITMKIYCKKRFRTLNLYPSLEVKLEGSCTIFLLWRMFHKVARVLGGWFLHSHDLSLVFLGSSSYYKERFRSHFHSHLTASSSSLDHSPCSISHSRFIFLTFFLHQFYFLLYNYFSVFIEFLLF